MQSKSEKTIQSTPMKYKFPKRLKKTLTKILQILLSSFQIKTLTVHLPKRKSEKNQATIQSTPTKQHPRASRRLKLTLGINRELAVAVAVGEHPRGVELPQGPPPALLGRASEDLVVVGVVQKAQHLGQRQVDVYFVSTACGTTRETVSFVGAAPDLVPGLHFSRDHARLTDATPASRETRVSTEHWYPIHLERMPNAPPDTTFAEPIIHFPSPHTADLFSSSLLSFPPFYPRQLDRVEEKIDQGTWEEGILSTSSGWEQGSRHRFFHDLTSMVLS